MHILHGTPTAYAEMTLVLDADGVFVTLVTPENIANLQMKYPLNGSYTHHLVYFPNNLDFTAPEPAYTRLNPPPNDYQIPNMEQDIRALAATVGRLNTMVVENPDMEPAMFGAIVKDTQERVSLLERRLEHLVNDVIGIQSVQTTMVSKITDIERKHIEDHQALVVQLVEVDKRYRGVLDLLKLVPRKRMIKIRRANGDDKDRRQVEAQKGDFEVHGC